MVKFREIATQFQPGEVKLESANYMQAWELIEPVLKNFAQKWHVFISVRNPPSLSVQPLSEDHTIFIRFFSNSSTGSKKGERENRLSKAYGVSLATVQGERVRPSGAGKKIVCKPERKAVAEVVEGTLFVLFNLPNTENPNSGALMENILADFERSDSFSKMRAGWKTPLPEVPSQKDLEEVCWNNFRNFFLNGDVFETSERVIRQQFEELKNTVEDRNGLLAITNDKIIVSLGPIDWRREGSDTYSIGCYDFVMHPKSGEVHFYHTTHGTKRHHTDFGNGDVCLGNVDGSMTRFIRRKEFDFAVAVAHEFLTTG